MGDKTHPRKSKSREVRRLKRTVCVTDRNQQVEINGAKMIFDGVKVINKTGKKAEKWFLLKCSTLLLV